MTVKIISIRKNALVVELTIPLETAMLDGE